MEVIDIVFYERTCAGVAVAGKISQLFVEKNCKFMSKIGLYLFSFILFVNTKYSINLYFKKMENIKLSEVKRLLLEGLEPFMSKYGYKMNKGKFAFIKKEKDRTSMLYFTENHWFDEVQIMPAVEVSIHEIENIIKKFSGVAMNFYDRAYWMNLNKLSYWYEGKSLAYFEYNDKDKYIIKNYTSDIDQAIKGISADFEKYGLRYIDEFGTVEGINKLLNNHSEKLDNTDFLFINRLIIGPIASNILNIDYLHCIDSRINYINENIDEMDEDYVNLFFQVKKYLEQ